MPPHPTEPSRDLVLNRYRVKEPGIARVSSNLRLTSEGAADVRHLVLDLGDLDFPYREGQSLGVIIPGLDDRGHANTLRLYSIASGRGGEDGARGTVSICVKRVVEFHPETGEEIRGAASNYLCDLKPGDPVAITGPVGKRFLLPDDPGSNLILVATGTGVSPFRGFLKRIFVEHPGWEGQVRLFFGSRSAAECLYRNEFDSYLDRPNFQAHYALSREHSAPDGQRLYVHHRMHEQIEDLWALLDREETFLYICGIKGMEDHIERVLSLRADRDGISWSNFRRVLQDSGRLLIETY